jgi:hypothetical protein
MFTTPPFADWQLVPSSATTIIGTEVSILKGTIDDTYQSNEGTSTSRRLSWPFASEGENNLIPVAENLTLKRRSGGLRAVARVKLRQTEFSNSQ